MLDPHMGLDVVRGLAIAGAHFAGSRRDLLGPTATDFKALVEAAVIPTLAVKRAFAYPVLELQTPQDRQ